MASATFRWRLGYFGRGIGIVTVSRNKMGSKPASCQRTATGANEEVLDRVFRCEPSQGSFGASRVAPYVLVQVPFLVFLGRS